VVRDKTTRQTKKQSNHARRLPHISTFFYGLAAPGKARSSLTPSVCNMATILAFFEPRILFSFTAQGEPETNKGRHFAGDRRAAPLMELR
jgi:hypothetical protein